MAKRPVELPNTGRFLVDTMRPRRVHLAMEGYRSRKSGGGGIVLGILVTAALLAAAAYYMGLIR